MSIAPLETRYAGCRFRSRLEARWAVFFDHLGIKWEYEPQGYTIGPDKRPYLPDFRLPYLGALVEVKGDAERLDIALLAELTRAHSREPFTLVLGPVPTITAGKVPTHALLAPIFDIREYSGSGTAADASTVNRAFSALEKLDQDEQDAVKELISHQGRVRIACHQAVFVGGRGGWALMPFGMPNTICTAEQMINPGTVWPIIPHPRLKTAYEAARSARFEHGEQG